MPTTNATTPSVEPGSDASWSSAVVNARTTMKRSSADASALGRRSLWKMRAPAGSRALPVSRVTSGDDGR
jgi:hypothetical protein